MKTIAIISILAAAPFAVFAAQSAKAQEAPKAAFSGKCTDFGEDKAACEGSGWCHHVTRKPVSLPDGKTFTPKAYCAFKPGFKQAWTQSAQK